MTTEPAQLAGIIKYCDAAAGISGNETSEKHTGNTLLMCIASNLYVKMAAPVWPFSCNTWIKVTSAELASPTNRPSPAYVIRPLV